MRKLTLVFVVATSAVLLLFTYFSSGKQKKDTLDVSAFAEGDLYGSIETKEVIRILKTIQEDTVIYSLPFSFTMIEGFLNTLKESGLDPSKIYTVMNTKKSSVHLYLAIKDMTKAKEYLEEYAYLFDFEPDTLTNTVAYSYENLLFSIEKDWLHINYTDSSWIQAFQIPVPAAIHPIDPSVFEETNRFHYSSSILDSLGVEKIVVAQSSHADSFQWLIQVDAKGIFPFEFSNTSFSSYTFDSSVQSISLSVHAIKEGLTHPFRKKLSRLFMDYGLNEQKIFASWNGALTFQLGPDIELVDTIITTTFDEDFNPLEQYRVRRKMRSSYLLFLGSDQPDELIKALNKNNFFQTRNALTRLPNGGITETKMDETGVLFTTLNAPSPTAIVSSKNSTAFNWNKLEVQLTLEKSTPTEVHFLLNLLLPSQVKANKLLN